MIIGSLSLESAYLNLSQFYTNKKSVQMLVIRVTTVWLFFVLMISSRMDAKVDSFFFTLNSK